MEPIEKQIIDLLIQNRIKYEILEHQPVYTCERMAKLLNVDQCSVAKSMEKATAISEAYEPRYAFGGSTDRGRC